MKTRPIIKTHGGKWYLHDWLISHFPTDYEKMTYVEPYVGGGSVFFNKKPSKVEIINDLDYNIIAIFRALQDEPDRFITTARKLKYSQRTFNKAVNKKFDPALNEFVLRRMSRGGLKKDFAWSDRLRGGQPGDVNAWETMLNQLPILADRLKNVIILNMKAEQFIGFMNKQNTFMYLDPPYMPETRVTKKAYEYEMTAEDHKKLYTILFGFKGKWALSGYKCEQYDEWYNWVHCRYEKQIVNHASQKKIKDIKTECLWTNYSI